MDKFTHALLHVIFGDPRDRPKANGAAGTEVFLTEVGSPGSTNWLSNSTQLKGVKVKSGIDDGNLSPLLGKGLLALEANPALFKYACRVFLDPL